MTKPYRELLRGWTEERKARVQQRTHTMLALLDAQGDLSSARERIAALEKMLTLALTWEGRRNAVEQHLDNGPRARRHAHAVEAEITEEEAAARALLDGTQEEDRMNGIERVAAERRRQVEAEGWTPEHDDGHDDGTLAVVAATLAVHGTDAEVVDPLDRGTGSNPWGLLAKHKGNPIRRLEIAGALIAAEIDRRLRLASGPEPRPTEVDDHG